MTKSTQKTPIKAIRAYCREICCPHSYADIRYCTMDYCPLYPYRFGRRPKPEELTEKVKN